ncbi:MAG: SIR2 family protein, partial [Angustibacter sp.]
MIFDALKDVMDLSAVDEWDLLQVADAVAAQPRGIQLLRQTVLDVADFSSAHPNYAHEVLALLLCEGAVTVLETNYDDCIERAAIPERLPVVRTAQELLSGPTSGLLKAHGCVTLPDTMLITTGDLAGVQFWANTTVQTHLSQDLFAFIGIGSVADYVRDSLAAVMGAVGDDHVILIGLYVPEGG